MSIVGGQVYKGPLSFEIIKDAF